MNLSKTITSLAILKVNWESEKSDHIEMFVPFIVNLLQTKKYKNITTLQIRNDFESDYGMKIPYHAMVTILNRVKNRGYLIQEHGLFFPKVEKIDSNEFSEIRDTELRRLNKVVEEIVSFSSTKFSLELEKSTAESAFLKILSEQDLSQIYSEDDLQETIIPNLAVGNQEKYVVSRFIDYARSSSPETFSYILNIKIGQAIVQTLLIQDIKNYECKLQGLNCYLDVNFLFATIGLAGEDEKLVYIELIDLLKSADVNLFCFKHTVDEFIGNLNHCRDRISNPTIDFEKEKRTLRLLVNQGMDATDIELLINSVEKNIKLLGIQIIDKPEYSQYRYQVDESKLKDVIKSSFSQNLAFARRTEAEKESNVLKDVDSISAIYRLRKGVWPMSLKEASHIFVTHNHLLARACNIFERKERQSFSIPACLHDVVLGTLIWIQMPMKIASINEKRLIADVSAALRPGSKLIKRYIDEIAKLKDNKSISDDDYFLLRGQ